MTTEDQTDRVRRAATAAVSQRVNEITAKAREELAERIREIAESGRAEVAKIDEQRDAEWLRRYGRPAWRTIEDLEELAAIANWPPMEVQSRTPAELLPSIRGTLESIRGTLERLNSPARNPNAPFRERGEDAGEPLKPLVRPTITELVNASDLSAETVRRIRTAAGIHVEERGGAARKRRYSVDEVNRMCTAVTEGDFMKRKAIIAAWAKWSQA